MKFPYTPIHFKAGGVHLGLKLLKLHVEVFPMTPGESAACARAQTDDAWFMVRWCSLLERVRKAGTDLSVDVCLDHLNLERLRALCWTGPEAEWPQSVAMRAYVNATPSEDEALAFGYATMMLIRALTSYRDLQAVSLGHPA